MIKHITPTKQFSSSPGKSKVKMKSLHQSFKNDILSPSISCLSPSPNPSHNSSPSDSSFHHPSRKTTPLAKAEDMGGYYRIVPDERDLNYGKYFTEGEEQISNFEDYNSHNTQRLTVPEIKEKLLQLEFIQQELRRGIGCAY